MGNVSFKALENANTGDLHELVVDYCKKCIHETLVDQAHICKREQAIILRSWITEHEPDWNNKLEQGNEFCHAVENIIIGLNI